MLGIAEGTVRSRCWRAQAKLAEALEYFNACAAPAAEQLDECFREP
jgi:RNA polymerase sigma-70 factor (ECF subfamily)